jgi:serine/threonine protein phosphatase PrpC
MSSRVTEGERPAKRLCLKVPQRVVSDRSPTSIQELCKTTQYGHFLHIGGGRLQQDRVWVGAGVGCGTVRGAVADGHGFQGETCAELAVQTMQTLEDSHPHLNFIARSQQVFCNSNAAILEAEVQSYAELSDEWEGLEKLETDVSQKYLRVRPTACTPSDGGLKNQVSWRVPSRRDTWGGTTLSLFEWNPVNRRMSTATAGDSAGLAISADGRRYITLTPDHSVLNPEEKTRLCREFPKTELVYATIQGDTLPIATTTPAADQQCYFKNVSKEWATYLKYGDRKLSVTRAVGDHFLSAKAGVSHEPEHKVMTLDDDMAYAVFATDGVWDTFKTCEVAHFVATAMRDGKHPQNVADALCAKNAARGKTVFGDCADNASAIVIKL